MITAISCCCLLVQDHALPRARDIVVMELDRDVQQHMLFANTKYLQVFRMTFVSIRLVSSDECYKNCFRVCMKRFYKWVSLAFVYFTFAALYKAPFDEEFCTSLLFLRSRRLSRGMHDFDSHHSDFYNAVFALLEEVEDGATAVDRPFRKAPMTQISVPGAEEMGISQEFIVAAMGTFHCSQKETKRPPKPYCDTFAPSPAPF